MQFCFWLPLFLKIRKIVAKMPLQKLSPHDKDKDKTILKKPQRPLIHLIGGTRKPDQTNKKTMTKKIPFGKHLQTKRDSRSGGTTIVS